MHMSRKAVEIDASSEGSGTDYSDDEVLMLKKDDGFRPVKGQPGMYYKVRYPFRFLCSFYIFIIQNCLQLSPRFFHDRIAKQHDVICDVMLR